MGKALAHLKYIQHRPGEDREKGGREFFGESDDELSGVRLRQAVKEMANAKVLVHKITIAPEINPADKKAFVREVMKELGSEKGLDLNWFGVEHSNTEHHHIHVVVLGKDRNGRDVNINKRDYDKIKEYGDRHLERVHPLEMERAKFNRETKEHDRLGARKLEREMRKIDGLELPWMHKQILREQYEPYDKWKEAQKAGKDKGLAPEPDKETPYFHDTIEAAGKQWSKRNSLEELAEVNKYLWDNPEERLPVDEYKKLVGWMREKEKKARPEKEVGKPRDEFLYDGKKYSKDTKLNDLRDLNNTLREKKGQRLPIDDYQKLRGWIENGDRARWTGVLNKQIELSKTQWAQEGARSVSPTRAAPQITPLTQAVMRNPVVGLFMSAGQVANTLVGWIDLRDNKDRLKEGRDALEEVKRDKVQEHNEAGRPEERKTEDRETIDKLDKAIDANQATRDQANDDKKKKRTDRPNEEDPFAFDPWGRW
jgi:hypothetical protein